MPVDVDHDGATRHVPAQAATAEAIRDANVLYPNTLRDLLITASSPCPRT